ncbi:hypothetical protein SAMN05421505_102300 [Sinosporangium album]|uniref:Uncharacterized protein n=1 Tax=Sinosporangium album TaxID=504805 RepID=A0A1G7SGK7_9ACTN|nr:DUF5944 family protein [Sinosporangium album]SDG22133.1 hypothetical protein SAMN05421505_102300 [Sinosporangium album]
MAPSFTVHHAVSMVRKEDFDDTALISEAFAKHIVSSLLPARTRPVRCTIDAEPCGTGVKLRFSSHIDGLDSAAAVTHRLVFVDREETRISVHRITPENPSATSEVLVLLDGTDRDYCHASVYDAEERLLAVESVVFNHEGKVRAYPFTSQYVSPLTLGRAELHEIQSDDGRKMLRFTVGLSDLKEPEKIVIALQATGIIDRTEFVCTPEEPEVHRVIPLDANAGLAPGEWVVIAVDDQERFLAQSLIVIRPR